MRWRSRAPPVAVGASRRRPARSPTPRAGHGAAQSLRAALALLYRGALATLVQRHGAELVEGVTEDECVEIAAGLLPTAEQDVFAGLTETWLRCAYGHEPPGRERVEALCASWAQAFGSPRRAPAGAGRA